MIKDESADIFDEIIKLEDKIAYAELRCLKMKNKFLASIGWNVTERYRKVDISYVYRKDNLVAVNADDAINKEMAG